MKYWPAKAPGESLDYEFDFTAELQEGEAIASQDVTATGGTASNIAQADGKITFTLSGGSLGTPAVISAFVTTDSIPPRVYVETAIVPLGQEPVSLAMSRHQVRITDPAFTDDDEYLLELIQAAREHVEKYCGTRIVPAAVAMTFDRFCDLDRLTQAPVQSITSIEYLDAAGAQQTLDPAVYEFVNIAADELRPAIRLAYGQSWPAVRCVGDAITVNAVVGYVAVPRPITRTILALVTQWYDVRQPVAVGQTVAEMPNAVAAMLANFRR